MMNVVLVAIDDNGQVLGVHEVKPGENGEEAWQRVRDNSTEYDDNDGYEIREVKPA